MPDGIQRSTLWTDQTLLLGTPPTKKYSTLWEFLQVKKTKIILIKCAGLVTRPHLFHYHTGLSSANGLPLHIQRPEINFS